MNDWIEILLKGGQTGMLGLAFAALVVWWSEKRYQRRKRKRLAMKRILGH